MVNEIKKYREFLEREMKKGNRSEELFRLHVQKIAEFQHERLVHLLIMLFFIFFTVVFLGVTAVLFAFLAVRGNGLLFGLISGLDLILMILSVAYVRHYYYLENGIQGLYEFTEKMKRGR